MKLDTLKQTLLGHGLDSVLLPCIVDRDQLDHVYQRLLKMVDHYSALYGQNDEVIVVSTPGRSEVCGNHTDHQHGLVLATSINLDALAIVSKDQNGITIDSDGYTIPFVDLNDLQVDPNHYGTSESLIKGILAGFKNHGYTIGGFHGVITSEVLSGSGLSSSACFEVLIATILDALYNGSTIDTLTLAKISQYAENVYFGKPSGLMDQCACAIGGLVFIDFQDPKDPQVLSFNVDFTKWDTTLCIVDTKGSHADLTDAYASIPDDMHQVAQWFDHEVLRDVDPTLFFKNIAALRQDVSDAAILRAIHFFDENKRVLAMAESLKNEDMPLFRSILAQSGNSSFKYLRNVWIDGLDHDQNLSLALALSDHWLKDHGVARVHGGGFAGTIQAFVDNDFVKEYRCKIEDVFGQGSCRILQIRNVGTKVLVD